MRRKSETRARRGCRARASFTLRASPSSEVALARAEGERLRTPRGRGGARDSCSWIRPRVEAGDEREDEVEPGERRRSKRRERDGREEREQRGVGSARAATPGPAAAQAARPTRGSRDVWRRDARARLARDVGVERARRSRRLLRLRARLRSQEKAGRRSEPREGGGLGTHAPGFDGESERETRVRTKGNPGIGEQHGAASETDAKSASGGESVVLAPLRRALRRRKRRARRARREM
jgi:hypothetical protein